jgi:hypothetical protein
MTRRQQKGRATFPPLDDHLVVPEVTRDEIIKGRRVVAHPAQRPHGRQHSQLDFLVRGLVAPGHETSSDLLTRCRVSRSSAVVFSPFFVAGSSGKRAVPDSAGWRWNPGLLGCFDLGAEFQ